MMQQMRWHEIFRVTPLEMWPLRGRIDLARHGAWSAVTRDTPGGLGAGMATGITPQIIKLKNLSPSSSSGLCASRWSSNVLKLKLKSSRWSSNVQKLKLKSKASKASFLR